MILVSKAIWRNNDYVDFFKMVDIFVIQFYKVSKTSII